MDLKKTKQKQILLYSHWKVLNSIAIEYVDGFNSKSNSLQVDQIRHLFLRNLQYFTRNL